MQISDPFQRWLDLPSLDDLSPTEAYELQWSGSFDPMIVARVVHDGHGFVALGRRGKFGRRGYPSHHAWTVALMKSEPIRTQQTLDESRWADLQRAVRATGFWSIAELDGPTGLDGSEWSIAGYSGIRRHLVRRWSPAPGTAYRAMGEILVELAGFDSKALY